MINTAHPLLGRIKRIESEHQSGFLCLGHGTHSVDIYFRDGLIEAISSNSREHQFGQYLLRGGFVDLPGLNRLMKQSRRQKTSLGEAALRAEVVTASELARLIHQQAGALLERCLQNGFEVKSFQDSSLSFDFSVPINLDSLLLELARVGSTEMQLENHRLVRLSKKEVVSKLPWSPSEISVLSQLNYPQTCEELTSSIGIEPEEVKRILQILHDLGFVEIVDDVHQGPTALMKTQPFPLELLIPRIQNPLYSDRLEVQRNEASFISEQFASLKVIIDGITADNNMRVIAVSSAHLQDGKSLISSNLALSLSRDPGRRVIVLDCDFRNPSLHRYFGISLKPGIVNYLTDRRLEPYCYIRRLGDLYIMTGGGSTEKPIELLSDEKMCGLIDYLRQNFDTILVDSAPLQPISDTRVVSRLVDGMLMVIRRGKTPHRAVEKALKTLDRRKFLGVVFNDVKPQPFHTYYDYKYYLYGKSSDYPYPQKKEREPHRNKRENISLRDLEF